MESSDEDGLDWVSQVLRMGVSEHPLVHPEGGTKGREREQRRARCESSEDYHLTCIVNTSTFKLCIWHSNVIQNSKLSENVRKYAIEIWSLLH